MELDHVEAFVAIVRRGGFTRAAATLHLSQPAIARRPRTAVSSEVSALVRRGDATLGLRYDIERHPDLVSAKIHDEPMLPVCSPRHRLARARGVDPRALVGERWITFPPRPGQTREPYSSALEHRLAVCGLSAAEILPIDTLTPHTR